MSRTSTVVALEEVVRRDPDDCVAASVLWDALQEAGETAAAARRHVNRLLQEGRAAKLLTELNRRVNATDVKGARLRSMLRDAVGAARSVRVAIVPGCDPPRVSGQPPMITVGAGSTWLHSRMFIPPRV